MKNIGFTNIQDWMLELDLDCYETIIFAVIFGFSQDGETTFTGSQNYLATKAKCSRAKVVRSLQKMVDMNLIIKEDHDIRGVHLCDYKVNLTDTSCIPQIQGCVSQIHNNIDKHIDINNRDIDKKSRAKFVKPSIEEVAAYCRQRGNGIDAEEFCSHYESNGWVVGKAPMKDWRAAIITWEKKRAKTPINSRPQAQPRKSVLQHNREVAERLFARRKEAMADEQ